jgi:hypothetical protein
MESTIIDKEVEVTVSRDKSYEGYGVFRFSDRALFPYIGKKRKYQIVINEVN